MGIPILHAPILQHPILQYSITPALPSFLTCRASPHFPTGFDSALLRSFPPYSFSAEAWLSGQVEFAVGKFVAHMILSVPMWRALILTGSYHPVR